MMIGPPALAAWLISLASGSREIVTPWLAGIGFTPVPVGEVRGLVLAGGCILLGCIVGFASIGPPGPIVGLPSIGLPSIGLPSMGLPIMGLPSIAWPGPCMP